ncbi:MAG: zf-HC2 domain-containing protein [Candidatus Aminicenantes bacterium]|nr:zf-HC2 domain-containing protein [Candidatus Aminicenantes bacterium]
MNCPPIETIYRYIEGDLPPNEERSVLDHLHHCPSCQLAKKERSLLIQAARTLSLWETPPGFTQRTMARILKQTSSIRVPLLAIASGFATSTLFIFGYLWLTGQNIASFFIGLNQTFLSLIKTVSVSTVKAIKLISILAKTFQQLGSVLLSGFGRFSALMSTEIQIVLVLVACVLYFCLFLAIRRKMIIGVKI